MSRGMAMNVHSAVFEAAAGISAQLPTATLPEIAFWDAPTLVSPL